MTIRDLYDTLEQFNHKLSSFNTIMDSLQKRMDDLEFAHKNAMESLESAL